MPPPHVDQLRALGGAGEEEANEACADAVANAARREVLAVKRARVPKVLGQAPVAINTTSSVLPLTMALGGRTSLWQIRSECAALQRVQQGRRHAARKTHPLTRAQLVRARVHLGADAGQRHRFLGTR